jgi:hypothetical protein
MKRNFTVSILVFFLVTCTPIIATAQVLFSQNFSSHSYYRLRQIDFDGTETFSKVVSVSQDLKGRISITPNPTSDRSLSI